MKIIALWNNHISESEQAVKHDPLAALWLSDSCLLRESRPFYVPEWDDDFRLFPSICVRIDRLGKGIAGRFASRYWSYISLWFNARAMSRMALLQQHGLPLASAAAYDASVVSAPFFPIHGNDIDSFTFRICRNGEEQCVINTRQLRMDVSECIQEISSSTTLKTGDVLMLGFPQDGIKVSPGDCIEVYVSSAKNKESIFTKFKIK